MNSHPVSEKPASHVETGRFVYRSDGSAEVSRVADDPADNLSNRGRHGVGAWARNMNSEDGRTKSPMGADFGRRDGTQPECSV